MRHTKTILTLLLTFPLPGLPALAQQNIITTAIGGGPNDMPAIDADVNQPFELALDSAGNLYIAADGAPDFAGHRTLDPQAAERQAPRLPSPQVVSLAPVAQHHSRSEERRVGKEGR